VVRSRIYLQIEGLLVALLAVPDGVLGHPVLQPIRAVGLLGQVVYGFTQWRHQMPEVNVSGFKNVSNGGSL
jgi:nitrate reductase NapE component